MKRKWDRMTTTEVLHLLRTKVYSVNPDNGEVTGPTGKIRKPFRDKAGYLWMRLYAVIGGRKKMTNRSVAVLVWMAKTDRCVPKGFEVHHDDRVVDNNAWNNLYCLHRKDHHKYHNKYDEPVPF